MSRPTLQRLARLSLVPGICTALALVAGAYANPDNTGKDASVAVQAVDTGNELSGANPSPGKVIGGALGSRLPGPRADGFGGLILAGGQCENDCGVGGAPEGEVCAGDNYVDATNGGCNSVPSVFGDAFCGVIICGTSSNFDTTGDGQSNSRDTDWYLISAAELAAADTDNNGVVQFQATLTSEFDGVTFFIAFDPDCGSLAFPGSIGFSGASCAGGEPAVATLILDEHPAGVVVFVSTGNPDGTPIFAGFECTNNPALNDYTLLIECIEPPLDCAPGSGPCGEPNGSPGCEDPECCKLVCDLDGGDPNCCIEPWSQICVNLAIQLGCVAEPCVPPKGLEGVSVPSSEDFDSYANGMLLVGVNGWGGWDDVPGVIATVSDVVSHSPPHSVLIDTIPSNDDAVQQYVGAYCEGQWTYTIWQFIPSDFVGTSYFILLNTYQDNGPKNWSTQVQFRASDGVVEWDFEAEQLPLITNQWVEIRVEINLDTDSQQFFYDGVQLGTRLWTDNNFQGGPGVLNIRAVDLYANTPGGASVVYYDDASLVPAGGEPCPADFDNSGAVDVKDLLFLLGAWGPCPKQGDCPADFDDSNAVDVKDLLFLLGAWGPCP